MAAPDKRSRASLLACLGRDILSTTISFLPERAGARARRRLLRRRLHLLNDALAGTPVAGCYWLDGGLLLGWASIGDILAYGTEDVELGFRAGDYPKLVASVDRLDAAGFRLAGVVRDNTGEAVGLDFDKDGTRFHFVKFSPERGHYVCRRIVAAPLQVTFERPQLPLEEVQFLGRSWLKPADHDLALTAIYGDWRASQEQWRAERDSPSLVAREDWGTGHGATDGTDGPHEGYLDEFLARPEGVGVEVDFRPVAGANGAAKAAPARHAVA